MTALEAKALTNKTISAKMELEVVYDLIDRNIRMEALLGHNTCKVSLSGADLSPEELSIRRDLIRDYYITNGFEVGHIGYNPETRLDHLMFRW